MDTQEYHINEGILILPKDWRDQTLNVFVTGAGKGLSLAISRDEIPWGMSFEEYVLGEIKKISENFDKFEEDGRSVIEINGARCPVVRFHWTSPQGQLFQIMTIIKLEKRVIILTATMPEVISSEQVKKIEEMFVSFKTRTA